MATDENMEKQQTEQPKTDEQVKQPDPDKCKLVLPEKQEKVAAQVDHYIDPQLNKAGYSERERMAVVLVTANQCLQRGADNVEFAGYNKAANSIVVQISGQNMSNVTVCVNVVEASRANPVEELAKMNAQIAEKDGVIAEKDKQLAEKEQELAALKAQNEEQKKALEQVQAKAQGENAKTANETAKPTGAQGETEKKEGFFSWLGKAIDTFREKVQTFVKEFLEHPFETIGKGIDCMMGFGRHNEQQPAAPAQPQPEAAQPAVAGVSR